MVCLGPDVDFLYDLCDEDTWSDREGGKYFRDKKANSSAAPHP